MNSIKKYLCLTLAISMAISLPIYAAEPMPKSDETMYINLDYYGKEETQSIVKRYTLNGAKEICDYGSYEKITNMSNYSKPVIAPDNISFAFKDDIKHFYFEGTPKEKINNLPWTFDVSYKLNGVDATAESLAGANGLVEINITVTPNPNTTEYFKNNMVLEAMTMLNIDDILSVDAPGAQVQTVADKKAIIFMALPNENQTFTMRIGSDDFQFPGIIMAMTPATLSQLDNIKELKDSKEKIQDSVDSIDRSLDVILNTLNNMQSGFNETADGIHSLEKARETISSSRDELHTQGETALNDLDDISKAIAPLTKDLQTTKKIISDENIALNNLVTTLSNLKPQLKDMAATVTNAQKHMDGIIEMSKALDSNSEQRKNYVRDFKTDMENLDDELGDLSGSLDTLSLVSSLTSGALKTLPGLSEIQGSDPETAALIYIINSKIKEINSGLSTVSAGGSALTGAAGDVSTEVSLLCSNGRSLANTLRRSVSLLDKFVDTADEHKGDVTDFLTDVNKLGEISKEAADISTSVIGSIESVNSILDKNEPAMETAITNTSNLLETAIKGIDDTHAFLSSFNSVLKKTEPDLDLGTKNALSGIAGSLEKSAEGLGQTNVIRNAKNTVKGLIDSEWEKNSDFLNIDTSLKPTSFTSDKNSSPESIQVILRTKEISTATIETDSFDPLKEGEKPKDTVFARIANIFKNIFTALKSIFN